MKKIVALFKIVKKIGLKEILERIELFKYDQLTGLYNRRALEEERDGNFTIIFLDLDNFKEINDKMGHQEGDNVLRKFSDILKAHSRTWDMFVRWGGDEFLLILPDTKLKGGERLIKRIKNKIDKESLSIHFSFGIIESKTEEKFSDSLERASQLMQQNKKEKKRAIS